RQSLPLHRLPKHNQGGAVGCTETGGRASSRCMTQPVTEPRTATTIKQNITETHMGDLSDIKEREQKLQGMGASLLRKEDAKFIRGQGAYIDDIKLPGMLFGAIVRSPYAHARIKSIDKSKALATPGVVAVLVADDLKPVNLHWMPTVGGDVQAVLADKKVHFQ